MTKEKEASKVSFQDRMTALKTKTTEMVSNITPWQWATGVLAVLLVVSFSMNGFSKYFEFLPNNNKAETTANSAVEFINTYLLSGGTTAELLSFEEENGLIKLNMNIGGQPYESYVTLDGETIFPSALDVSETLQQLESQQQQQAPTIPKSDKPVVELFVMSHCPYGTQMEKAILPAVQQLGSTIDFQLKFVNYAMHGQKEINEQLVQYCIQQEYPIRLNEYLWCFLEASEGDACLEDLEFNTARIDQCVNETDAEYGITEDYNDKSTWNGNYPSFSIYQEENVKYGVRGSPTLVINEQSVQVGRTPAQLLAAICSAFNEPPEECNAQLSTTAPSAGFGLSESGQASAAQCG